MTKTSLHKTYPRYKPSGIEWLGDVPEGWEVRRLKFTIDSCNNGIWGEDPVGDKTDVACIRVADFNRVKFTADAAEPTMRQIKRSQLGPRLLRNTDLLLEKSGGGEKTPVGAVVRYVGTHEAAVCSNFVARMPVRAGYEPRFLTYLHAHLYSRRVNTCSIKQSIGIQNLDSASYLSERGALPPLPEQRCIADYLDRETARLDGLTGKYGRLIALLDEKRQALITYAVTKGLDATATLKASGVEWLGDVPDRWKVKRLKFHTQFRYGDALASDTRINGEFDVYGSNGVVGTHAASNTNIPAIVVGRKGSFGKVVWAANGGFVIDTAYSIDSQTSQQYLRWIYYLLQSLNLDGLSEDTGVPGLAREKAYNLYTPLPPQPEQRAIADYLDRETAKIDTLKQKVETAIETLKEYRAALISAAVTGKIDVRHAA